MAKVNHILLKYDKADFDFLTRVKKRERNRRGMLILNWEEFVLSLARRVQ